MKIIIFFDLISIAALYASSHVKKKNENRIFLYKHLSNEE
jgi:hypothetical protein